VVSSWDVGSLWCQTQRPCSLHKVSSEKVLIESMTNWHKRLNKLCGRKGFIDLDNNVYIKRLAKCRLQKDIL